MVDAYNHVGVMCAQVVGQLRDGPDLMIKGPKLRLLLFTLPPFTIHNFLLFLLLNDIFRLLGIFSLLQNTQFALTNLRNIFFLNSLLIFIFQRKKCVSESPFPNVFFFSHFKMCLFH